MNFSLPKDFCKPVAVFIVAFVLLELPKSIYAQSCSKGGFPVDIETRTADSYKEKCAFPEFEQSSPPRWQVYRKQRIVASQSATTSYSNFTAYYYNGGTIYNPAWGWGTNVTETATTDIGFDVDLTDEYARFTCALTKSYTGNKWDTRESESDGYEISYAGNGIDSSSHTGIYEWSDDEQTLEPTEDGTDWKWVGTHDYYRETDDYVNDGVYIGNVVDSPNPTAIINNLTEPGFPWEIVGPTEESYSHTEPIDNGELIQNGTLTLSINYTDTELIEDVRSMLPPLFPSEWSMFGYAYALWDIYYSLGEHRDVIGGAMYYRVRFPGIDGQRYKVTWQEIMYNYETGGVSVDEKSETVLCSEGEAIGEEHFVDVPVEPVFIFEVNALAEIDTSIGAPPGTGGPNAFSSLDAPSCQSCGGNSHLTDSGPSLTLNMGRDSFGESSGQLRFSSARTNQILQTPSPLYYDGLPEDAEVMKDGKALRQVKAAEALADVVTVSTNKYEIRFYLPSQISGPKADGVYPLSGSPFVTWTVENPNPSTNNQLKIYRTLGSEVLTWDYVYTSSNSWKLTMPGGLEEAESQTVNYTTEEVDPYGYTNVTHFQKIIESSRDSGGVEVRKRVRTYKVPDSEYQGNYYLLEDKIGPDTDPQITSYDYYPYGSPPYYFDNYQLKTVIHPDGSWEWYGSVDSEGKMPWIIYSYGDQLPTDDGSLARKVDYSYYSADYSVDDSTFDPKTPRVVTESILGTEVSRRYTLLIPTNGILFERRDIVCQTPDANITDTNNLITITRYFGTGAYSNEVQSIQHPDGTMEIYEYSEGAGLRTNIVYSGQPNVGKTAIINGTKTVTVKGLAGQVISRASFDILSGIILSTETCSYPSGDQFYQSPRTVYLDGTSNVVNWGCCNVDNETDRDGVTTQYYYDELKRRVAFTRNGVTISNVLDAAGSVLKTVRIGTNDNQITLNNTGYDLAGRMIAQTNALDGVTTYSEIVTNNHKIRVTTNPDGGTVVENYFVDGSLESMTGTAVHGERHEKGIEATGDDAGRQYSRTIKLDAAGYDTDEWTVDYTDFAGRPYKTLFAAANAPYPFRQSFYNYKGQLWKEVDPDGVVNLFDYNAKGESVFNAVDIDQDDVIDFNGTDRITFTTNDVTTSSGVNVRRSRTYVWATNSVSSSNLVAMTESSTDGLRGWQTQYRDGSTPVVSQSCTAYSSGGNRYVTNTAPGGSYTVSAYSYGRLVSMTQKDSGGSQIGQTTYGYDAHGRQNSQTDARNGTMTYTFNNADTPITITTPNPGTPGGAPQTTATYYNKSLQATNVVQPDGTSVTTEYFLTGELKKTYGSRTYPVEYTYDYGGRMKTMKTWQNFAGNSGSAVTTWNYDPYQGFLTGKVYADSQGPVYSYTPGGRLESRVWARGVGTTNSYNTAGDLWKVQYSDATPGVTNTYDRLGRITQQSTLNSQLNSAYNWANELLSESFSGGVLNGLAVTNAFDAYLRRNAVALNTQLSTLNSFGYDNAGRLQGVTNGNYNASYSYVVNSPLVGQIVFKNNSTTRMTTTKQYDFLNRLQSIGSVGASSTSPLTFAYTYNDANQRTRVNLADGSYWRYEYDSLGQVKSGKRYWSDWTPVAGQQFEYGFDDIGNRTSTKAGGDEHGADLRYASYTANSLNQYTQRTVPGYLDIMGIGLATNSVTVNSPTPTPYRRGEYFRKELSVNNSSTSVWQTVTVASPGQTSVSGNVLLAKTPQAFTYDADGNLTSDGLWTNRWNAENRLIATESLTTVPSAARMKEEWSYLADGRWKERIVSTWNGSSYVGQYTNRYIWDGKVLLAVLDHTNGLVMSLIRGLDLNGTHQGAGGVGGVLAINIKTNGMHFAAYDGNGNVAALVSGTDGTVSANYEYDPFGQTIRITGAVAKANPIRFSSQYADDVTGDLKYLYRDYLANTGRWKNRDPVDVLGGVNLYGFVGNNSVNNADIFGLWEIVRKGMPRAIAFAEEGDTIRGLATRIRLNESEWRKWLQEVEVYTKPYNLDTPLTACDSFSVPNTAYVNYAVGFMDPRVPYFMLIYSHYLRQRWSDAGYRVRYYRLILGADVIKSQLNDLDIYTFAYIGHGAAGNLILGNDESEWVNPGRYTPFGIDEMLLIACNSDYGWEKWRSNVASRGILTTVEGDFTISNMRFKTHRGEER